MHQSIAEYGRLAELAEAINYPSTFLLLMYENQISLLIVIPQSSKVE